jgi:hypothetical protein
MVVVLASARIRKATGLDLAAASPACERDPHSHYGLA